MDTDNSLGLGDLLAALKRRRFLLASLALVIVVVGVVLAIALPDRYRSTATFRIVTDRIEQAGERAEYADQYVFALKDKVFASGELEDIVRELQPYPNLSENPRAARAALRGHTRVAMVTQRVLDSASGRERSLYTGFTVAYENRVPEKAKQVAQALANAFMNLGRSNQLALATGKRQFYAGEVDRIAEQIAGLENKLADFKSANFEQLPESAQSNFVIRSRLEEELGGVEREVRTLQQNRVFLAQQLRQAQVGPAASNLRQLEEEYARKSAVYAENHPDLVALRRQIDTLRRGGAVTQGNSLQAQLEQQRAILAEARQRYSDDHPDIRRITRTIESLEERIAAGEGGSTDGSSDTLVSVQLQTQLNAADTQIAGLQARAGALRARLGQLDAQLGAMPDVEREYQAISRGLSTAREQYNQMIGRRMDAEVEIAAIKNGAADKFTLFAEADTPDRPAAPPRLGIVVVSLMLAGILAISALVVAEVMESRVRGAHDVRGAFGFPPLAVVPEIRNSVSQRRFSRRVGVLVGSVLIGAPALYIVVRMATA